MKLLENIWLLCRNNGISVGELSVKLGFSNKLIYHWDDSSPKIDNVIAVADYFGVSLDELCGRSASNNFISDEEKELILAYRSMNNEGQTALRATLFGFVSQGIYKKCDMDDKGVKKNDKAKEG